MYVVPQGSKVGPIAYVRGVIFDIWINGKYRCEIVVKKGASFAGFGFHERLPRAFRVLLLSLNRVPETFGIKSTAGTDGVEIFGSTDT